MQDHLIHLLQDTLNPNLVGQAHKALDEKIVNEGVLTTLLIISDNTQVPMNIRQMSLIFLKSMLKPEVIRNLVSRGFQNTWVILTSITFQTSMIWFC